MENKKKEEEALKETQYQDNLSRIKNRIVVISGKGGVGKSTTAVNLAYGLAFSGKRVGIIDVDVHGPSIAKMMGIEGKLLQADAKSGRPTPIKVHDNMFVLTIATLMPNSDDPLIWRGPLKMGIIKQFLQDIEWPEIDYLVVDCPPGTGDEPLSIIQLLGKVDGSVIVSTPQDVAFLDARKTIKFSEKMNVPILGLVENMASFACPHCGEAIDLFKGEGAVKAAADFGVEILGHIPVDLNIPKTTDEGRPYIYDFGKTAGAIEFTKIVHRIIEKVEDVKV